MHRTEIQIRDPFIFTDHEAGCYYLYGTTDKDCWGTNAKGFDAFRSNDLEEFEGPFPIFRTPETFWANQNFWAPELHYVNGNYYLLATFSHNGETRGTQILKASSPLGPFIPISESPITPADWLALDGTLYYDQQNQPWIVFCHEWLQVGDGEMCALRVSEDLKTAVGAPALLFHASDAPWCRNTRSSPTHVGEKGYVTDGPCLFRTPDGTLLMTWSTHGEQGYCVGISRSDNGEITGKWSHVNTLFDENGGHGMLFQGLDGSLKFTLHGPNDTPHERALFFDVAIKNDCLEILR